VAGATQAGGGTAPVAAALQASTSLTVSILSSPWATLDNNQGQIADGPRVFLVEAVVTNTGSTTATNLVMELNYDEDPANDWILLRDEDPVRKVDLAPETAYHAYWFATYTTTWDIAHQYTVTADADNTDLVSTSHNFYGDPEPGKTVKTRKTLSAGNSGISQVSADVVVGVAFTVLITYDLGTEPMGIGFSPVGNLDFEPGAYRLLSSNVRFYNDEHTLERTVHDRIYFDTLPAFADNAATSYTFIALTPSLSRLCPCAAVDYADNAKYDQFFCEDAGVIPITGTLTFSMTKQASSPTIQQNEVVTYTVSYANQGTLPLVGVWIWDDVDTSKASIITDTINPPSDPGESSSSRIAWYLGSVPASGQAGSSGTLTFTIHIDGDGSDLEDGTPVVNRAYMGILAPSEPAVTSTVITTVQAPTIAVAKSDGKETVRAGEALTYTLRITNSGSVTATNVVVTDHLPSGVSHPVGQVLVYNLDPIPPQGGHEVITIPATVDPVPGGSVLTNTMVALHENEAGWLYDTETAVDTTFVQAPIWFGSKSDAQDPVVAGTTLTYTLQYLNNSVAAALRVFITDTLPGGVAYGGIVSQSPVWQSFDHDPGPPATLSWYTPSLGAQVSGTVVFTVTVNPDASGIITNNMEIASGAPNTHTQAAEVTTVNTEADLELTKSDDPEPVVAGATLTYTLVFTNHGPGVARSVVVTDTLSEDVTFGGVVSQPPALSGPVEAGQHLNWSTPTIAADAWGSIVFTVNVHSDAIVSISNSAVITGSTPDPEPESNRAEEDTAISCLPDIYEPDDVPAQAKALGSERQEHNFCGDATDWTAFSAEAGNTYTITTSSWGRRADTHLALYWSDGQTLLAANDDYEGATDFSSRIVWKARKGGTYLVRATNRADSTGNLTAYDIWLETEEGALIFLPIVQRHVGAAAQIPPSVLDDPPDQVEADEPEERKLLGVINHVCPDDYDHDGTDDRWELARPIEPGIPQVHSFDSDPVYYAPDKDYVSIDLKRRQFITFTVGPVTNTHALLELWGEAGASLNVTGTDELVWQADAAGHYYLSASPLTGAFGCSDEAGYVLLAERSYIGTFYLQVVMR
jgi:uncharacterized repeat protein (TIGR01451 family)